jgi:serine/threonine protein kinase
VSEANGGSDEAPVTVGRYLLHRQIARGGMATIHLARVLGDVGFSRIVAAKRLRPELAEDREFVAMFLDEARIASKVHHRNVVPVLDVGTSDGEVVLVQEYVHGAPLSYLLRATHEAGAHVPLPVAVSVACQVLAGLHAAHETVDELGTHLHIIHRDVSPQNVMIATDGSARLLDFGVAKAAASAHITRKGTFKGKLAYAAPEHIRGHATRQSDVFSLAVVLWELVVGERLHHGGHDDASLIQEILTQPAPLVTEMLADRRDQTGAYRWRQLEVLAPIIAKGLAIDSRRRWNTAAEMEEALTASMLPASSSDVVAWLRAVAGELIAERDRLIATEEAHWRGAAAGTGPERALNDDLAIPTAEPSAQALPPVRPRARRAPFNLRLRRGGKQLAAWSGLAFALAFVVALVTYELASDPPLDIGSVSPSSPTALAAPELAPVSPPTSGDQTSVAERSGNTTSAAVPLTVAPAKPLTRPSVPGHVESRHIITAAPHPAPLARDKPTPVATPTPPSRSVPAVDCSPPYYFQGDKKIFKPSCV